jgi:RimJ/RimL family protein N-acetyltransferase
MPAPIFPFHTARLILRPFAPGDQDDLFAYMSRPEVVQYLYGGVKDRAETGQLLQKWMAATGLAQEGDRLVLAIVPATLNQVIGEVVLKWRSQEHRQAEAGYVLHPDYNGQGYATEATGAMLELGFREYGFHRIVARCDARNTASYKVMERLGMRREAHFIHNEFFKGEWGDELVYAILEPEWAKRAADR